MTTRPLKVRNDETTLRHFEEVGDGVLRICLEQVSWLRRSINSYLMNCFALQQHYNDRLLRREMVTNEFLSLSSIFELTNSSLGHHVRLIRVVGLKSGAGGDKTETDAWLEAGWVTMNFLLFSLEINYSEIKSLLPPFFLLTDCYQSAGAVAGWII
jgi:hypothetical protein